MKIQQFIDLSLVLADDTPIYPGDPQPHFETATTVEKEGYNLSRIQLGSQSGSHLDAPNHFSNAGKTVDQLPLAAYFGKGLLLDVSYKTENEPILLADIEKSLPLVKEHPFVLFKTGWNDHYLHTEKFFRHPFVSGEVAAALIQAGIRFLGIDTINADQTGGTEFPVHDLFSRHNLVIGENWAHFGDIHASDFYVSAFPLLWHCDGSPVRPVAIEEMADE